MQIAANGIFLEVKEYGPASGPALVLIRGHGTQLNYWPKELIQGFASAGFRTIIFDNRDVGKSQRCPRVGDISTAAGILANFKAGKDQRTPYTLDDMAKDVTGLLDSLGIDKAHVFGISMGGMIAQIMATRHADRLLSAIFVMTSARPVAVDLLARLLATPQTRIQAQDAWVQAHADYGSPGYPMAKDAIRAEAAIAWDRGYDAGGINRQALALLEYPDMRAELPSITRPTLVIHGQNDTLISPDMGHEIAALIPGARMELVQGMGHVITPLLSPVILNITLAHLGLT